MKQTTKRLSSTLIALLLLVAAFVVFFNLIQPEYTIVEGLRAQEVSEQLLLASEQALVKQVQGIVSSYQSQAAQAQEVSLAMPIGPDTSEALAQIYGIAANSGLTIQNVAVTSQNSGIGASSSGDTTASSASSTSMAISAVIKPKGTLTFQVAGIGSYGALKTFLQGVETNIRVFDVTGIGISPIASLGGSSSSAAPQQDLFSYTLTVVAYYQTS